MRQAPMLLFALLVQTTSTLRGQEGMMVLTWDSSQTDRFQGLPGLWSHREYWLGPVLPSSISVKEQNPIYMESPPPSGAGTLDWLLG